jgi:hypothetical protein
MEERFVPVAAAEARPIDSRALADSDESTTPSVLNDPRALQILTTEHWSLLTARSLVYNEAFARSGMFLAFISATFIVLGLISTATGFSDSFLVVAAVLLTLDLFIGLTSLGRISAAGNEDIRYLQGMNRLRHAYHEMVPGLGPYFITSRYDDFDSTLLAYGPAEMSTWRGIVHGFTTTPAMVAVICSAVGGALLAVLLMLATHDPLLAGVGGGIAFLISVLLAVAIAGRAVADFERTFVANFPKPMDDEKPER